MVADININLALSLVLIISGWCGQLEKIEWNVVKLGGKDIANVNIKVALETIREGKIMGLPTDTVYGFVADATRSRAVRLLYNTTGPNYSNLPITITLDTVSQIPLYADMDLLERSMISQLLPGRVTILFRKRPGVLSKLNPDYDIIPIRIPGQKERLFLRKLSHQFNKPLALVGARKVGRPHSVVIEDFEDIRLKAYVVFDGGKLERKKIEGSTIVDLSNPRRYKILWPGCMQAAVISVLERYELEEWPDGPNITLFNPT